MSSSEIDHLFSEGVAALREGDKAAARRKLSQVLRLDPAHEQAWLWLSGAVVTRRERIFCLQRALAINPGSAIARQGLERLGVAPQEAVPPPAAPSRQPASAGPTPQVSLLQRIEEAHPLAGPVPPEPLASPARSVSDESWRAPLLAADQSVAARGRTEQEGEYSLLDVFDAWAGALLLRVQGAYRREVETANVGHTLLNLLLAGLLAAVASFLILQLFILPAGGIGGLLAAANLPADSASIRQISQLVRRVGAGMALVSLLGLVIGRAIGGVAYHVAARVVGGKGDLFQTLSAVSLSTVAQSLGLLIPVLWLVVAQLASLPFEGVTLVFSLIYLAWGLYAIAQDVVAITAAHPGLGLLPAIGALLLSGVIMSILSCCLGAALGALGSL